MKAILDHAAGLPDGAPPDEDDGGHADLLVEMDEVVGSLGRLLVYVDHFTRVRTQQDPEAGEARLPCGLSRLVPLLRCHGVAVAPVVDPGVTHVICDVDDVVGFAERWEAIKAENRGRRKHFFPVTAEWAEQCSEKGWRVDESPFHPSRKGPYR